MLEFYIRNMFSSWTFRCGTNNVSKLLNDFPSFASYLSTYSKFSPNQLLTDTIHQQTCTELKLDDNEKQINSKYIAHHLGSNMRRGCINHCTVVCAPYVIFLVPFDNDIINDKIINENKNIVWCSLLDITDEILCYSPLHLVSINQYKLEMDPLLHLILSNEYIVSRKWMTSCSHFARLELKITKSMLEDTYQMKQKQVNKRKSKKRDIDNEPIQILHKKISKGKLYLGSIKAAKNIERLKELNISHIIDCQAKRTKCITTNDGFIKLCVCLDDSK